MIKWIAFCIAFLLPAADTCAQATRPVKGVVYDAAVRQPLKDASVSILNALDSTLDVFDVTDKEGRFLISNIAAEKIILQIRYEGYELFASRIDRTGRDTLQLDTIYLRSEVHDLGNVTVTQSPVQMKKDTIEFSASAYRTKPNATAEDLLKKLPGLDVSADGSIRASGEEVQRILVNGKRFFGDDPKIAARTLSAEMIEKIQVFDDQSDQSRFSGFEDGNRVKTINLTTKKNLSKGQFGRALAGGGTGGRYEAGGNINRMNGDQQVSLTGQINNTNKSTLGTTDKSSGNRLGGGFGLLLAGRGGAGGGAGITETRAGGVNYRDKWGDKDVTASYFYNAPNTTIDQRINMTNAVTADSANTSDQHSANRSRMQNHRFTFNLESADDSLNAWVARINFNIYDREPTTLSSTVTTGFSGNEVPRPVYESVSGTSRVSRGYGMNGANMGFRHRFSKGSALSIDLGFSAARSSGEGYNYAVNTLFLPTVRKDTMSQYTMDASRSVSLAPTVSLTQAIARGQIVELRYSFHYTDNQTTNNTFRYDKRSEKFSAFDSLFSNAYEYRSHANLVNLAYRFQREKINFSVGSGMQFMDIISVNTTKKQTIDRNFVNYTPAVSLSYNFTRNHSLRIYYNGRTGQPSISQLQPVLTTVDSINFQIGNPDLRPQFTHSFRMLFSSFDMATQRMVFATLNASIVSSDIQTAVTQFSNGGRLTTFVNLGGTVNLSGYFNYIFPIQRPKSNLSLQTELLYSQSRSLLTNSTYHNALSTTRSTTLSQTLRWTTNLSNHADINLSASLAYNPVRNTLTPMQNSNFLTQTLGAEFTLYSNNGWILAGDINYTRYSNRAPDYNTPVWLVTPSIARQFLKNKAGEIRFSCFDLLKQNTAISSSVTGTQSVNIRTNTLTRYCMLAFTYHLRGAAVKKPPPGSRSPYGGGE